MLKPMILALPETALASITSECKFKASRVSIFLRRVRRSAASADIAAQDLLGPRYLDSRYLIFNNDTPLVEQRVPFHESSTACRSPSFPLKEGTLMLHAAG